MVPPTSHESHSLTSRIAAVAIVVWLVLLCLVPDPRPLAAPDWTVRLAGYVAGVNEPTARFVATAILRAAGVGLIGVLLAIAMSGCRSPYSTACALAGAPLLAVTAKRINFGSMPIWPQLVFILSMTLLGTLAGLALRRNWAALLTLTVSTAGLAVWGTSTRVPNDVYEAWRGTVLHVLQAAPDVPDGDEGFLRLLQIAFAYAEDNSHGTTAILPNRAAILALGLLLGDDTVTRVGGRALDVGSPDERTRLRHRIRLSERTDLSRHFWVSAALTTLSDEPRAMMIGLSKEVMDSTPGGSGFSFIDMAANAAGIRLAVTATRSEASAHAIQVRVRGGTNLSDMFPSTVELPENISGDSLQSDFGGLGGAETRRLLAEIDRRIAALPLYR